MNTILASLVRLNEMTLAEPANLEEKLSLIREEEVLFTYLENAGRPVAYNHSKQCYEWVAKNTCGTCGDEPWVCLTETGIAICPKCAALLLIFKKKKEEIHDE
jgi:hypothetical protein